MTRCFLRLAALVLTLATVGSVQAADVYLVEVLVFENSAEGPATEHFPVDARVPPESNAPPAAAVRYTGAGLKALAASLAGNKNYRVLVSNGWQQPVADRGAAPAVPVSTPGAGRFFEAIGGTLRLYEVSPLLFVEVNLEYQPVTDGAAYHLREKRRLKLNELHYFDHPRFGALVRVSRVPQS